MADEGDEKTNGAGAHEHEHEHEHEHDGAADDASAPAAAETTPPEPDWPLHRAPGVPFRDADGSWTLRPQGPTPDAASEAETLRAAQARVDVARARGDIPKPTVESAQQRADWQKWKRRAEEETFEQILARVRLVGGIEEPTAPETPEDRLHRVVLARVEAGIPGRFTVCPKGCPYSATMARCRFCASRLVPVNWALLVALTNKAGHPALGGVEDVNGNLLRGEDAVIEVSTRLREEDEVAVLLGPTRAGKSITAAAYANELIEAGAERIVWTSPNRLRDPGEMDRALSAKTLFLDDMGEEFVGATKDSGLAAQRAVLVADLVKEWAKYRSRKLIITTFLESGPMGDDYDHGVAGRIYEAADTIRIQRKPRPKTTENPEDSP